MPLTMLNYDPATVYRDSSLTILVHTNKGMRFPQIPIPGCSRMSALFQQEFPIIVSFANNLRVL